MLLTGGFMLKFRVSTGRAWLRCSDARVFPPGLSSVDRPGSTEMVLPPSSQVQPPAFPKRAQLSLTQSSLWLRKAEMFFPSKFHKLTPSWGPLAEDAQVKALSGFPGSLAFITPTIMSMASSVFSKLPSWGWVLSSQGRKSFSL